MDTTDTLERDPLMLSPLLPLPLNLKLRLNPGMDILTTMDTTDILMDTTILERGLLRLNPKLLLPPRLRLNPGMDTMVDTMDILTDMDTTDIPTDMAVTGGRFLSLLRSHVIFSIPY